MIHPLSDVQTKKIGEGTQIWQFCVVLKHATIGKNCNINANVFIENDVIIGDRVTIKSGVQLWDGIEVEDDVFIGPNATFTNDLRPRSKQYPASFEKTTLKKGVSIGANATILPGITVGSFAMVGAGTVVNKDIPERALAVGNPCRLIAWLNEDGTKMKKMDSTWIGKNGQKWVEKNGVLIAYE